MPEDKTSTSGAFREVRYRKAVHFHGGPVTFIDEGGLTTLAVETKASGSQDHGGWNTNVTVSGREVSITIDSPPASTPAVAHAVAVQHIRGSYNTGRRNFTAENVFPPRG